MIENDFLDARIDDHLGAKKARGERGIKRGSFQGCSMVCSLSDRVFFAMRAETLFKACSAGCKLIASRTSAFIAIRGAAWSAVVSGGDDSFVFHHHCGNFSFHAIASACHNLGDRHEILVPVRSFVVPQNGTYKIDDFLVQVLNRAIVHDRIIRHGLAIFNALFVLRLALTFSLFHLQELIECLWILFPLPAANAIKSNFWGRFNVQQEKIARLL